MNDLPVCLLCTRDETLRRRIHGLLASVASVHDLPDLSGMLAVRQSMSPVLVMLDARREDYRDWLSALCGASGQTPVLVLAAPCSDPARTAEGLGAFAVEPPDVDRRALQGHLSHARQMGALQKENRVLRRKLDSMQNQAMAELSAANATETRLPTRPLSRPFRDVGQDVNAVLRGLMEEVADATRASRVGVFLREAGSPARYRLREGVRCLSGTGDMLYPTESPLVLWLRRHAHFVARTTLDHIGSVADQMLLEQSLDAFGAEVLIPLHRRDGLIGWMFLGRRVSGLAYAAADVESFMALAEYVSASLETAMLHEALELQKLLLETVLQQAPVGIVAVDADCRVNALNAAASEILAADPDSALQMPAARISGHLADLLARRMDADTAAAMEQWRDPRTRKQLCATGRRLMRGTHCLGAVAMVQDFSELERQRDRETRADRALFWAELAAAIAHEVRNPLVAIKTFVQLLPERYQDAGFRSEFRSLANAEIDRVSRLVDQIHAFANPPPMEMRPVGLDGLLDAAVTHVQESWPSRPPRIVWRLAAGQPQVTGDSKALLACFVHLVTNAFEALKSQPDGCVTITSESAAVPGQSADLSVRISDNGPGMSPEQLNKAFSPFGTTKARGIGLGLPIAKRIVLDHGGGVSIDSTAEGCTVIVKLPVLQDLL